MNKKIVFISVIALMLAAKMLHAEVGCMENSWHLKQRYDNKEYHYVCGEDNGPCHCPCSKYMAQAGKHTKKTHWQCPVCKHIHVPRSLIVIRKPEEKLPEEQLDTANVFAFLKWKP